MARMSSGKIGYGVAMTNSEASFYLFLAGVVGIAYFFVKTKSYVGFLFGLIALALPSLIVGAFSPIAGALFYYLGSMSIGLYLSQADRKKK